MIYDEFSAWEKLYGQKHGLCALDVPHLNAKYRAIIELRGWASMLVSR